MSKYHLEVIVYKNARPAYGHEVTACGTGFFGGFTEKVRTDSDGRAVIHTIENGSYTIYVNGANKGVYRSPSQAIIYL